jgi:hypothetical protein
LIVVNETTFFAFPLSERIFFVSILEKRSIFASVVTIIDFTTILSNSVLHVLAKRSRSEKAELAFQASNGCGARSLLISTPFIHHRAAQVLVVICLVSYSILLKSDALASQRSYYFAGAALRWARGACGQKVPNVKARM